MPRIMIIHPEGNINNNPNLTGIVEILCEKEYEVDIYSPRVAHIEQLAPCQGANLILTEVGSSELNAVLPLDIFQSTGATENPITCNIPHYDLVIGVDRGIVEASSIARQLGVPYGLISYEILFREETGNEYTMPDRHGSLGVSFAVCQDRLRSYHLSQENGIPLERIIDIPVAGRAIKSGIRTTLLHEKLGLPKKTRIALYIGGVTYKWAGIDELIEHSDKWPDNWVLVLHQRYSLYDNEFTNRLSCKKKKNIFISPFPNIAFDKLHILLNAADIGLSFYIPQFQGYGFSDRNNLKYIGMASGKIATYLQHGLPIVVNEIGEMSGYVRKHKLGRVVTDFSNLGQILGSIDNDELNTFKDNSYDFYNAHLDLDVTIQPFLKIISTLISSKTRQNHISDVANVRPEFNLRAEKELSYMVDQNVDGSLSEDVRCYFQPPVGSVETFIDVKPKTVQPCLFSVYQALKGYTINDFGMGLNAVSRIIYHIFKTKLHTPLQWRHDLWHRTLVVQFTSDLVERRTGKLFDILDEIEIARFAQEFLAVEGAERTSCIKEYQEKLLQGLDLGQPLYVSGTVLNYLGASVDPHAIFMIDGARRISAVALNRKKSIEIKLIILEEEYSEQFLEKSSQNEVLKAIDQLAWFNNYQSIPLVGIRGQRSLNRFALMDMSLLRDQVVMDFGCNLGQACIKAVMAGAQAVWGVEGMPDTFRIAQEIGRLSGFPNLHYLNVDFNAFDFSRQIDEVYSDQADYAFFFSVYRTKELSQRDTLFRYIIKKTRKGIFFEGHADPVIDTVKYYDWLFESFGLNYQYLGNSEGSLRPLFFIPLAERLTAPPKSPVAPVPAGEQVAFSPMLFRVSAIVSTYASERFIEGRLNDLLEQTLGDQLEIIVVDSNSPENERAIVERYAARHSNIVYIRTDQRETVYQAWNRGARAARGVYLTNANTDDRLRTDALELLAGELDANPSMALVYADFFITGYENMTFNHHIRTGYSIKPDYNPNIMLHGCHMGPQPIWRRSLHDEIGYFDETLVAAGDYEFWCRIACRYPMKHVPLFLGLYLHNPKGICNSNVDLCFNESQQVKERYLNLLPPPRSGLPTGCYYREKVIEGNFVNIGMVTYNRLEFTRQAVAALIEHTDFPYVLTVVDNNSSDGTREYLAELKLAGIIRHLILLDENVGVAKASNLAWSLEPNAAYYLKLDNDIVIQKPGWLWAMVRVVEAVTEAGAVAYNFEPVSYPVYPLRGVPVRPKNGNLGGACVLVPKRTHELLGYWCEDYGLYGEEDADYGFRIMQASLLNIYMDDEEVGIHLPAGKAAVIDPLTLLSSAGGEEKLYAEYRAWKDELRRINVLTGHFVSSLDKYKRIGGAIYLDSTFVKKLHKVRCNEVRTETVSDEQSISIIIPAFNQAVLTRRCIEAVFKNKHSNIELIVVDNGSTDWTPEYLLSLGCKIQLITNKANLGFARACNQGAAAAQGKFLVFLNNDTVPQPGWLEALMAPAVAGDAEIVGAKLLYSDGTIQHAGVVFDEQGPLHVCKRMPGDTLDANQSRYCQAVTAACMLITAELFQSLGGFDEGYKNGFEDVDLCLSAKLRGARIYYQPASVVIHYEESSEGRKLYDEANYSRFLRRWYGRWKIDYQLGKPLVSIIIPVFNQLPYTRQCLDTVLRQLDDAAEVIVVDNGSTDGTLEYLRSLGAVIKLVHHDKNLGFAKGCNSGAHIALGRYLVFLNNDTEPCDGWLESMLEVFEQEQKVGIVGSKLLFPGGTIQHAGVTIVKDPFLPAEISPCHLGYGQPDVAEFNQLRECQAVTAACMMIASELFRQIGGFDEGYWNGFEDVDLCFKTHEAGYRIIYQPASVVIHHESKSGSVRKEAEMENLQKLQHRWAGRITPEYLRVSLEKVEPFVMH